MSAILMATWLEPFKHAPGYVTLQRHSEISEDHISAENEFKEVRRHLRPQVLSDKFNTLPVPHFDPTQRTRLLESLADERRR